MSQHGLEHLRTKGQNNCSATPALNAPINGRGSSPVLGILAKNHDGAMDLDHSHGKLGPVGPVGSLVHWLEFTRIVLLQAFLGGFQVNCTKSPGEYVCMYTYLYYIYTDIHYLHTPKHYNLQISSSITQTYLVLLMRTGWTVLTFPQLSMPLR